MYCKWCADFIRREERLAELLPRRWNIFLQAIFAQDILGPHLRYDRTTATVHVMRDH
jgi:hypothetical protein